MSLTLRCPACGAEIKLSAAEAAAELKALDKAAGLFGEDWDLAAEYLEAFRSAGRDAGATGRPPALKRRLRLLRELWLMWQGGKFEFRRTAYVVDRPEFREALRTVCDQVKAGLTNHNYLRAVLVAGAQETSKRREREFKAREQGLGAREPEAAGTTGETPAPLKSPGGTPALRGAGDPGLPAPDPEWQARFAGLVAVSLDLGRSEEERQQAKQEMRRMSKEQNERVVRTAFEPTPRPGMITKEQRDRAIAEGEAFIASLPEAGHEEG
jgi:hypothetical protein